MTKHRNTVYLSMSLHCYVCGWKMLLRLYRFLLKNSQEFWTTAAMLGAPSRKPAEPALLSFNVGGQIFHVSTKAPRSVLLAGSPSQSLHVHGKEKTLAGGESQARDPACQSAGQSWGWRHADELCKQRRDATPRTLHYPPLRSSEV